MPDAPNQPLPWGDIDRLTPEARAEFARRAARRVLPIYVAARPMDRKDDTKAMAAALGLLSLELPDPPAGRSADATAAFRAFKAVEAAALLAHPDHAPEGEPGRDSPHLRRPDIAFMELGALHGHGKIAAVRFGLGEAALEEALRRDLADAVAGREFGPLWPAPW